MVNSFIEYWQAVKRIGFGCEDNGEVLFFRGLPSASYDLLPSALRSEDTDEGELCHSIMLEYPEEFKKNEHLSNLVKVQHCGGQTRLMDISSNPLISLYFTCEAH